MEVALPLLIRELFSRLLCFFSLSRQRLYIFPPRQLPGIYFRPILAGGFLVYKHRDGVEQVTLSLQTEKSQLPETTNMYKVFVSATKKKTFKTILRSDHLINYLIKPALRLSKPALLKNKEK